MTRNRRALVFGFAVAIALAVAGARVFSWRWLVAAALLNIAWAVTA